MLDTLKNLAKQLKHEFAVYRLVLHHPQTPWLAKGLLGLAIGYLLLPFDLIPDFIPIIGQLDELVIIPLLLYVALKLIPPAILTECRNQVESNPVKNSN